jgi:uncharacterized protein YoxC
MNDLETLRWLVDICGAVIVGLLALLWWFVRRDRATVYRKLGEHSTRIESLETNMTGIQQHVFGSDRSTSLENRLNNTLQPIRTEISTVLDRVEKLTIAIARANPTMRLDDLR